MISQKIVSFFNINLRVTTYTEQTIGSVERISEEGKIMNMFIDSMVTAIRKYRTLLRKYLPQAERVNQLQRLDLKNPRLYEDEIKLYSLGGEIVEHLTTLTASKNNYYSYSGINKFVDHLKALLDKYKLDEKTVRILHTTQVASRAIVRAAQLLNISGNFQEDVEELEACHRDLIAYGSSEQIQLYETTLNTMIRKHNTIDPNNFYRLALQNFMKCLAEEEEQESGQTAADAA